MNLPTYSLSDSPQSTILNVCLGLPPATLPPSNTPPSSTKGKARATTPTTSEEDQWLDAEFRSSTTLPPKPSNIRNPAFPVDDLLQPSSCTGWDEAFATANSDGWAVYRTYPFGLIHKHVVPDGSLRIVLPLHRTNIIFLVGGPPSPLYSPNKVILYDSARSKPIFSIELTQPVLGLTARKDKLVVVLQNKIHLFKVSNRSITEEGHWETSDNPKGLACLGSDFASSLLVFLGRQSGKVQLVNLPPFQPDQDSPTQPESFQPIRIDKSRQAPYPSTSIIVAHTTSLASLAITPCGKLIATASVTGTLIRIWDSKTSTLLRELRRGTDGAAMWGLRFRPDGLAICASSDKGTIHVWSLQDRVKPKSLNQEGKPGRPLALLKPYLPKYFHSTWSDAFFRLPAPSPTAVKSLPLSMFSSLPRASSGVTDGSTGPTSALARAEASKPPTIEDDVSSVSWVLATPPGPAAVGPPLEPQIVAITRSGGWFRLRIPARPAAPDPDSPPLRADPDGRPPPKPAAAHGTPNRLGISNDPSVVLQCVEYRRFGQIDDWSDGDD